jgi:succinate dehydrogenase / fumarate reductase membrane anchor subunit
MSRRATGLRAWILQRISAGYLALFSILVAWRWLPHPPGSYEQWRDWLADPWISVALLLFFASLLLHAWIGIRDVLIDYVHPFGVRLSFLALTGVGLISCGLWALQVVLTIRAGG